MNIEYFISKLFSNFKGVLSKIFGWWRTPDWLVMILLTAFLPNYSVEWRFYKELAYLVNKLLSKFIIYLVLEKNDSGFASGALMSGLNFLNYCSFFKKSIDDFPSSMSIVVYWDCLAIDLLFYRKAATL